MKQSVWSAAGAAVLFTCLTAFFGHSLCRRMGMVNSHTAVLEKQLKEWTQSPYGRDFQARSNELLEYTTKQAASDAQRQLAAMSARATDSLIKQLHEKLDREEGAIGRLQDWFEDEFGRRIERNKDAPHQYEVGEPPTVTSDLFRYPQRKAAWNAANVAVNAYNQLLIQSRPDLDRYERDLKAQQQVIQEATAKWETFSRQREDLERKIEVLRKTPREGLPSVEEITRKLKNSTTVAAAFGVSDAFAFLSALALTIAVWVRTALIAGCIGESRILPE